MTASATVEQMTFDAFDEAEACRFVESSGARLLALKKVRHGLRKRGRSVSFNLTVFNQQLFSLPSSQHLLLYLVQNPYHHQKLLYQMPLLHDS